MMQWGFLAGGFAISMFFLIMGFFPFLFTLFIDILIMSLAITFAFFQRYGLPMYEFLGVYIQYLVQPKEMVYGSNSMKEEEEEDFEEEIEFELI
jgi:hypothetical protein